MLEIFYRLIDANELKASRIFSTFIVTLIILNVLAVILESFESLYQNHGRLFQWFEMISVIIFSIEYLMRMATVKCKYPGLSLSRGLLKYIFSFMAMIDLLAILPFYLPLMIVLDLRFLRILRLVRIFRIFKLSRYTKSLQLLGRVLKNKKEDLIVTLFVMTILLVAASSLMYYLENPVQPEQFPNIIASFWWGIATLTTVGYGDVYPITVAGKLVSGLIAVLGIGLVALPTGIVSSGFLEEIQSNNKCSENYAKYNFCPNCGRKLKD
ncbi:ion transporter [Alkalibacter saccharofermentans]|uniref:Voltage-gated potassium channel n=1 Tax=Alkalibacter saccharofermentans DSM 14828 TaxID=1120975 RepID=A0A1M4ZFH4_9FIRM|nr:ion transporter [Alkalibacter saccharofermentans]SHF16761.1 voltage-gated potassium channel [Alkalibacter saccharofermentans DSM 14828]